MVRVRVRGRVKVRVRVPIRRWCDSNTPQARKYVAALQSGVRVRQFSIRVMVRRVRELRVRELRDLGT